MLRLVAVSYTHPCTGQRRPNVSAKEWFKGVLQRPMQRSEPSCLVRAMDVDLLRSLLLVFNPLHRIHVDDFVKHTLGYNPSGTAISLFR